MNLSDFDYTLPEELIAHQPLPQRTASRLLKLNRQTGEIAHGQFMDVLEILQAGDVLVFNDTRVLPARLWGAKASGGKVEVLIERVLDDHQALAHVRASKTPKPGGLLQLEGRISAEVLGREGDLFRLEFKDSLPVTQLLEQHGHMPLPPYIRRPDTPEDQARYQTVYARQTGAVASPTAGLHFDEKLMQQLAAKGVIETFITLHVGAGTFQPIRVENILEHRMHRELIEVPQQTVDIIRQAKQEGRRVIAVGTTSLRTLEAAAKTGELVAYRGETDLFIYPSYPFQCVDGLMTNFHLPKSSLLLLVCAFAGREAVLRAYEEAIALRYRFYSYGDAMVIV